MYTVIFTPDDNSTLLVTCPDLPEVTTFGEDEEGAIRCAADAIEEALATRIARHEDVPAPSRLPHRPVKLGRRKIGLPIPASPVPERRMIYLPSLTSAKVELYRALRAQGVSKGELGRRLGWDGRQIDRLFNLNHRSPFEHFDLALSAIGKRLDLSVEAAA